MRKLSVKWVPKCLNADQKRQRCQSSEQLLEVLRRDPNDFLSRLVTMDETWSYHYDQETKQQSMEWRNSCSPRPKKFRVTKSAGKVLVPIFGIKTAFSSLIIFQRGQTINARYYLPMLVQMKGILKGKRRGKITKGVLLFARQCPGSPGTCNPDETGLPGLQIS